METSDSDYFESADEDFLSDDETQIEQSRIDVKRSDKKLDDKIIENTTKLSISDDSVNIIKKKDADVTKEVNDKIEEKNSEETRNIPQNKENNDLPDISPSYKKPDITKTTSTSTKTECWEPGMNYENVKKSSENQPERPKRPEFGIPPARVGGCWFPNNQRPPGVGPPIQMPPAVSRSSDETKPKRPEFGIPPARTTCWVPGVSNASNMQPQEPHPAYLGLMKKKKEEEDKMKGECQNEGKDQNLLKSDEKKENQISLKKDKEEKEQFGLDLNEDKEDQCELRRSEKKEDQAIIEENMWDNDEDWGDFEAASTKISDSQNLKQPSKEIKKPVQSEDQSKPLNDENMWDDDDWEPIESNQDKPIKHQSKDESNSSWGGWGNWGLSTVLSTATTLTNQVSQGLSTVLETGIGAPDPEELARINKLEKEKIKETHAEEQIPEEKPILGFGFGNLMHGVTKLVETTSTKVIHGGLDTLETIGKKTMEVLQENDPGLKKKRAFLKLDDDKPILSQVLREAKEKAERENKELEKKHFARKANYETLFDDHQGLVHLEALEMLSKQCDIKLQSLIESNSGDALNEMQETLDQVKELCELPEEEDEDSLSMEEIKEKLETAVLEININITYKKLLATWEEVEDWLTKVNLNICNKNELHQQAIEALAQLTALAVEQFHKAGELLLVKEHRSTADEADSLVQLTITLTTLIGIIAAKFSEKLNMISAEGSDKEEVNSLITNVFFEAANSSSYIQDAFQLLMPVLQVGAV